MFRLFAMFLMMFGVTNGGSELMDAKSRKFWFEKADVVVTGKVVHSEVIYMSGGKVIESERAIAVIDKFYLLLGVVTNAGIEHEAEPRKKLNAFLETEDGKILDNLTWRYIVGVSVEKIHKGKTARKILFCSWASKMGDICPHVGLNPEIGKEVSVYLRHLDGLKSIPSVFDASHFLMGENVIDKSE